MNISKKKTVPIIGSNDWWRKQKKNSFHNILKLALYILIFFLIWGALAPLINNLSLFSWWKNQERGLDNKYSKQNCISFVSLSYFLHFKLYWLIGSQTGNEESTIQSEGEALMIMSLINNYADGLVPGGALTGKALCQTIIPDWPPPAALIKIYTACGGKSPSKNPMSINFSPWTGMNNGTWPLPEQLDAWKAIMFLWGAGGLCGPTNADSCSGGASQNPSKPPDKAILGS